MQCSIRKDIARQQEDSIGNYYVPLYEVHCLLSHPLRQVFRGEWLLHDAVVLHENAVEVWDDHYESRYQTRNHDER